MAGGNCYDGSLIGEMLCTSTSEDGAPYSVVKGEYFSYGPVRLVTSCGDSQAVLWIATVTSVLA